MAREEWVCMMRVRNEGRWIRRALERTFQVVKTVVLWDDGSDDNMEEEVMDLLGATKLGTFGSVAPSPWGWVFYTDKWGGTEVHYLRSPFRPAHVKLEEVSEIRDKNILWWYVKAQCEFNFVFCADGDETLSLEALRNWQVAEDALREKYDMLAVPFVYLWNDEGTRRVDAIYGDSDGTRPGDAGDGLPRLRFPRMFTTLRCDEYDVYEQRFAWHGHRQGRRVLGGFHCGSVPQENFHPNGGQPTRGVFPHPVIHFGYLHNEDRVKKHAWYNSIDPKNVYEGEYSHIIEQPNIHTPGPSAFAPWEDR